MNKFEPSTKSPYWGTTTKTVVGLGVVAALGALLYFLHPIIGPLLLAFVLSYLLYPVVEWFQRVTRFSWRASVGIVYVIFIILLLGFISAAGIALYQQLRSLIEATLQLIRNLPQLISALPGEILVIGGFQFDLSKYELNAQTLAQELLNNIQPIIGQTGSWLGAILSGTASFIGWTFFILLVTFFILSEAQQKNPEETTPFFELPGYNYDFYRISKELKRIWNAFLRGQIIVVLIEGTIDAVVLSILGVRYALALGLLAGFGRFVPYVGQFTNVTVSGLVALFQNTNYLGIDHTVFTIIVIVWVILMDTMVDNIIAPHIFGRSLGLHPAAILVTALIGARLIGLPGIILAAPVLASIRLFGRYVSRKMLNLDPWREPDIETPPMEFPWVGWFHRFKYFLLPKKH